MRSLIALEGGLLEPRAAAVAGQRKERCQEGDRRDVPAPPPADRAEPAGAASRSCPPLQQDAAPVPARQAGEGDAAAPSLVLNELRTLLRDMFASGAGRPILVLAGLIVLVLIGNMIGQVRLNQWNGSFFDAVERRDATSFLEQLVVFLLIVAVLLSLVVAQTWLQERLKIRIRERLTGSLLDTWLRPRLAYRLGLISQGSQPDQRMQEDCRLFAEFSTELGVGLLQASMLLVSFVGVLWALSSHASFEIWGHQIVIPGYMVWIAVGYAGCGSLLTYLVGKPLIALNTARYMREAELRFALVRVNENRESVAFYAGEKDERRNLDGSVRDVLVATRLLSGALARLTWITSGYGWLAIVVPILAAAPGYFAGRLSFGDMMMVVGAFHQVQSALRYFVDNFPKIADWRSALLRVATFRNAMAETDGCEAEPAQLAVRTHEQGHLSFRDVRITLRDGTCLVVIPSLDVTPGERVLIVGESGCGKSTIFRAIASLWHCGTGLIERPPETSSMFLPQRPYLPLGTLRAALCYPDAPDAFSPEVVHGVLARCGLGDLAAQLDVKERWDCRLSLGQQQRLAFARTLLHKPDWLFMDEASSALDEAGEAELFRTLLAELPDITLVSIGHRPQLRAFHGRVLSIKGGTLADAAPAPEWSWREAAE